MSGPERSGSSRPGASDGRARQLGIVALCVLGLVVAAFAVSALPDASADAPEPTNETEPSPTGGSSLWELIARLLASLFGSEDGDGVMVLDGDGVPTDGCAVVVRGDLTPGSQVAVRAWEDGDPLAGLPIRFNGEFVGKTDSRGQLRAQVPYTEELRVSVPRRDGTCQYYRVRETGDRRTAPKATTTANTNVAAGPSLAPLDGRRMTGLQPEGDENASGTYDVDGAVNLTVRGEAYPGERVTLVAAVGDVPMRNATVTVGGETVGRTNETGQYAVRVPDDGTARRLVSVSRGEFSGRAAIDVRLLRVAVAPAEPFPLPGTDARIRATFGEGRTANATVLVDGERFGTTGPDGGIPFRLPPEPWTDVAVSAEGQTATTSLWPAYASTFGVFGLLGVLLVGSHATAYGRGGRRAVGRVAAAWLAVCLLVASFLVAGPDETLALVGLVALAGIVAVLGSRRDELGEGTRSIAAMVSGAAQWLLVRALRTTETLDGAVRWGRAAIAALRARLTALPRSASRLAGRAAAWLRALSKRAQAATEPRTVAAAVLGLGVLAGAANLWGVRGFVPALGLLVVVGLLWRYRPTGGGPTAREPSPDETETPAPDRGADGPPPLLREQWATFARWIAPTDWRRRTPGEVSRAAVARGYPREPVAQLTRVFREVEYDDRPRTDDRSRRATEAFEALKRARRRAGEEAES